LTGKLTALIRIENSRFGDLQCLIQSRQAKDRIQAG